MAHNGSCLYFQGDRIPYDNLRYRFCAMCSISALSINRQSFALLLEIEVTQVFIYFGILKSVHKLQQITIQIKTRKDCNIILKMHLLCIYKKEI